MIKEFVFLFIKLWKWILLCLILIQILISFYFLVNYFEQFNELNELNFLKNYQKSLKLKKNNTYEEVKDENSFCDLNDSLLISAVKRSKSCKLEFEKVYCLNQKGLLFPNEFNKTCLRKELFLFTGCYLNNQLDSNHLIIRFKELNNLKCSFICTQHDKTFFGLQNNSLCHCFDFVPSNSSKNFFKFSKECNITCENNISCINQNLIQVYETGIKKNLEDSKISKPINLAFILSLNGREIRQIKRLIRLIYKENHFYLIHVDIKNDFLYQKLKSELINFENIIVTNERFHTIWGGSQLLSMLLNSLKILNNFNWQFVLNLSESDFPIKPLKELENYLSKFRNTNFLKFHGQSLEKFINKQGLKNLFLQCEGRMWRLSDKKSMVKDIVYTGGSDWFGLHKSFVDYLINDNSIFLSSLKQFYNYSLLPAESFFHTVLINSNHCESFINNNLHFTNWNRKLGCKCQHKNVVDWCGCSPNVILLRDYQKINQKTKNKPLFFARKFDPLLDNLIINLIESKINSKALNFINYQKYWHLEYDYEYDKKKTYKQKFKVFTFTLLSSTIIKQKLITGCTVYYKLFEYNYFKNLLITQINVFFNQGKYIGTQISLNFTQADRYKLTHFKLEFLVLPKNHFKLYNDIEKSTIKLISLKVCTDYDIKEDIFRNFGCLISQDSQLVVKHEWDFNQSIIEETILYFVFFDSDNQIEMISENSITLSYSLISYHFEPRINKPLKIGIWNLLIVSEKPRALKENLIGFLTKNNVIGGTKFLISPSLENFDFPNENFSKQLQSFWFLQDVCFYETNSSNECNFKKCSNTTWSSSIEDPKSEFKKIN